MLRALSSVVAVAAIVALFVWGFIRWADTPIVYKSWSTQKCVKVDDPAQAYSCANLPDRYELVWTK
jgi:hypothetical protein